MRPFLLLLLVTACWHEAPPPAEPEVSFVARMSKLRELRTGTHALAPQLGRTLQRIRGLASEAERAAIGQDLAMLHAEVERLSRVAADVRRRGDDARLIDDVDRELARAAITIDHLRAELRHAKTLAEQEAFEALKKKLEAAHDEGPRFVPRDPRFAPPKPAPLRP